MCSGAIYFYEIHIFPNCRLLINNHMGTHMEKTKLDLYFTPCTNNTVQVGQTPKCKNKDNVYTDVENDFLTMYKSPANHNR
jgi:hypothetical protein